MNIELIEKLAQISIDFQGLSKIAREKASDKYKAKEPSGLSAIRLTLDGQISRLFLKFNDKIDESTEKISYQLDLSESFIRTHFVVNDLLLSGDIIEALTLIRKQIENLTRLIEIDEKPLAKLLKKTPNVCEILKKSGKKLYPELSEVAHFGTPRIGALIRQCEPGNDKVGPSVFPFYSDFIFEAYKQHAFISISFVYWTIGFLKAVYKEKYDSELDENIMEPIFIKAIETGIFEINSENK